jgi:hypothetical protein
LAKLEASLGRPVTDFFDLITGTSTGGIIAIALGLGVSAERIRDLYEYGGKRIFTRRPPKVLSRWKRGCISIIQRKVKFSDAHLDWFLQSRYTSEELRSLLQEVYGDRTLGDAKCSRLVIPAIDLIKGSTVTFKTPHQPDFIRDRHLRAVDVALATGAAPTFFPAASFNRTKYCDGGLWANNPSVVGYAEAIKIHEVCRAGNTPFDQSDIRLLSIGTGSPQYFFEPADGNDGIAGWGPQLFEIGSGAQSQGAHFKAQHLVGPERYKRINFLMPNPPWELDAVDKLQQLIHLGEEQAANEYPHVKSSFFETLKQPIQFF